MRERSKKEREKGGVEARKSERETQREIERVR
jgi:hypothetical protein